MSLFEKSHTKLVSIFVRLDMTFVCYVFMDQCILHHIHNLMFYFLISYIAQHKFESNSREDFESQLLTLAFLNVITRIKTNGNSHNGYGSDQMP